MSQTSMGANFVIYHSDVKDLHHIITFGTQDSLMWLYDHHHWHCHGTFKVAPEIFMQVYMVPGFVNNAVLPYLYALLQHKDEGTNNCMCFEDNYEGWVLHNGNRQVLLFPTVMWKSLVCLEEGVPWKNAGTQPSRGHCGASIPLCGRSWRLPGRRGASASLSSSSPCWKATTTEVEHHARSGYRPVL